MGIVPKDKPIVISAENYAKKRIFKYSFVNPKILGLLTVLLLMVLGVGAGVYMTQAPSQTQTKATLQVSDISFKPAEIEVKEGSGFNINVFGNALGNQITSAQLAIKYDPEFLDLTSITPKEFLPRVLIAPIIASGSATVSLGTDGNSGISGSGILASLSFKAKKQSASPTQISFDESQTRINILGNTASPLNDLKSAKITINPEASQAGEPTPPSIPVQTQQTQPSPQAPIAREPTFDFNSDSKVNSVDLSIMYSAWGNPRTERQIKADINGDGTVNGIDYSLFLPHFKK